MGAPEGQLLIGIPLPCAAEVNGSRGFASLLIAVAYFLEGAQVQRQASNLSH